MLALGGSIAVNMVNRGWLVSLMVVWNVGMREGNYNARRGNGLRRYGGQMASKGSATIYLELDRVRGALRVFRNGSTSGWLVQRTGWKRLLTLTKSLCDSKAQYGVRYEFTGAYSGYPSEYSDNGVLKICDGARAVAYVEWVRP